MIFSRFFGKIEQNFNIKGEESGCSVVRPYYNGEKERIYSGKSEKRGDKSFCRNESSFREKIRLRAKNPRR